MKVLDNAEKRPVVSTKESNVLRNQAQSATSDATDSEYELAEILYELWLTDVQIGTKVMPVWQSWGYANWSHYVGTELHLSMRKVQQLLRVWRVWSVRLRNKWDKHLLLPMTKMYLLTNVVSERGANEWLRRAATMTVEKLQEELVFRYHQGEVITALYHFGCRVTAEELADLDKALGIKRAQFNDMRKGSLLHRIIADWLKAHANRGDGRRPTAAARRRPQSEPRTRRENKKEGRKWKTAK